MKNKVGIYKYNGMQVYSLCIRSEKSNWNNIAFVSYRDFIGYRTEHYNKKGGSVFNYFETLKEAKEFLCETFGFNVNELVNIR